MTYDDWKTTPPDEYDTCDMHGYMRPCPVCRLEYEEQRAEAQREER